MAKSLKLIVEMEVTVSQALALHSMFEYWNQLASLGSSRNVAFFVDGDGNFKPKCKVTYDTPDVPELTDHIKKLAVISDKNGNRVYDFDPIAWSINNA